MRVWCLLSLAWAVAVAPQVEWPWQLWPVVVAERVALKQTNTLTLTAEAETEARSVCSQGPISIRIEAAPPFRVVGSGDLIYFSREGQALLRAEVAGLAIQDRLLPEQQSLETAQTMARLKGRPNDIDMAQVRKIRVRDVPATITARAYCIPDGAKPKAMALALAAVFGPPLIVPVVAFLAIWLVAAIYRWLKEGFETAKPFDGSTYLAHRVEVTATPPVSSADTIKALGWSVLALTIIDIFLRGALSFGKATGTNLLVFILLAMVAFVIGIVLARTTSVSTRFSSLVLLWGGGLATIAITIARYL